LTFILKKQKNINFLITLYIKNKKYTIKYITVIRMKSSTFFVSLGLLIEGIGTFKQGKDSSFFYSSSTNAFNYSKITDIVIFWVCFPKL